MYSKRPLKAILGGGYFIEFYIMAVLRSSPRNAGLQRRTKILCEKQVVYN